VVDDKDRRAGELQPKQLGQLEDPAHVFGIVFRAAAHRPLQRIDHDEAGLKP
jgi:hypothetical protein